MQGAELLEVELGNVLARSNLLNGRVIVGSSTATLTAVPEPLTIALLAFLVGSVLLTGGHGGRRRNASAH